jgi:hypothetical protein
MTEKAELLEGVYLTSLDTGSAIDLEPPLSDRILGRGSDTQSGAGRYHEFVDGPGEHQTHDLFHAMEGHLNHLQAYVSCRPL